MIRVLEAVVGMRVVTPRGKVARVIGISLHTGDDLFSRLHLEYLDPEEGFLRIQAKLLRGYDGPPVVWPDEVESMRLRHGDKPLGLRLSPAADD